MSQSLDQFVDEIRADIEKFAADYRRQHAVNPDHFPLVMPEDNAGVWLEFFVDFMTSGADGSTSDCSAPA